MKAPAAARDATYGELKKYIVESTGLAYYETRDKDFQDRLLRRLHLLGITSWRTYLELLRDGAAGRAEVDELIAELTIGETFFFRDENQFNAIRRSILPDLLEKNAARKALRVWSAGSANGAEAYSVAILLRDEFGERVVDWDVSILGTDINRRILEQARSATYDKWALRSTADDTRERCFHTEGTRWRLANRYRAGVRFQCHNLVEDQTLEDAGLGAFDLILCRNVMIYFDRLTAARVVERLHRSLLPGAWLVVGHADHDPNVFREFDAATLDGVSVYRRRGGGAASEAPQLGRATGLMGGVGWPWDTAHEAPGSQPPAPQATESDDAVRAGRVCVEGPDQMLGDVRALADRGASMEAETLCSTLIERSPLEPLPHFYQALILQQMGRCDEAEQSLRRSLYLDRRSVLAHYHLGLLLRRGGQRQAARQHFENTLGLLATLHDGHVFEHGDGIRAADLRELAHLNLEDL